MISPQPAPGPNCAQRSKARAGRGMKAEERMRTKKRGRRKRPRRPPPPGGRALPAQRPRLRPSAHAFVLILTSPPVPIRTPRGTPPLRRTLRLTPPGSSAIPPSSAGGRARAEACPPPRRASPSVSPSVQTAPRGRRNEAGPGALRHAALRRPGAPERRGCTPPGGRLPVAPRARRPPPRPVFPALSERASTRTPDICRRCTKPGGRGPLRPRARRSAPVTGGTKRPASRSGQAGSSGRAS